MTKSPWGPLVPMASQTRSPRRTRDDQQAHAPAPVGSGPAISCSGVSKIYPTASGPVHALDDIDLQVGRGEFVAVLGPSGCGKSTLLKLVAGLRSRSGGDITFLDQTVDGPQTDVGIVFQDAALLDWRTVIDNVLLQVDMRGRRSTDDTKRAQDLLTSVGLGGFEKKRPYHLSGGMRQRTSICRALVHEPPVLLMDEPFGALDALSREQIMLDLQRLWLRDQLSVLFITHSIPEAVFLADRVVVMSARPGRIVEIIDVDFPRPRPLSLLTDPGFNAVAARLRTLLA